MSIQQQPQVVSSLELLVELISPVPIPAPPVTPVLGSELEGNGGAHGGVHGGVNGGTATAVAPVAAVAVTGQPIYTSAGPLSHIIREIANVAPTQGMNTLMGATTFVTPIAIQAYFLWITNLSSAPLTPVITVSADPTAVKTLTTVADPTKPLTASVLAITSVGDRTLGTNGNIFSYLKLVSGVPTLTLPAAIPAGGTALFTLVGNYALFPDLTKATLEVRGSLSIAIDSGSSAQFSPVLLEPQTRTAFVVPGVPAPAETAFALPTARGKAHYTLPGPAFYIKSAVNGYVLDASGPVISVSKSLTQVVINPINDSPTQLWYFTSDGYIVNAANNYVLDALDSKTSNGTPIIVYPRNNPVTNNQKWNLLSNGVIQSRLSNVVVDVDNAGTAPGTRVQIYTPNGTSAQSWIMVPTLA